MKKSLFLFFLIIGVSAFGQLKVTNNFGQSLYIRVGSNEKLVPNKEIGHFEASGRIVWLECRTTDGKIKFSISKEVSRTGNVKVGPEDNTVKGTQQSTTTVTEGYSSNLPTQGPVTNTGSLASILNGGSSSSGPQSSNSSRLQKTTTTYVAPVSTSAQKTNYGSIIPFVYKGDDPFKIFSLIGRGLEFKGSDTLNSEDNAKNRYNLNAPLNQDLIIGIGIKEGKDQSVWRYAEIRKRINSGDTACVIYQKDIKKMSTSENKSLKSRLVAEGYKIFFEPEDSGEPISLGYKERSRSVDFPIGQFYVRASYTDPKGMFHRTVFVPKHVTKRDKYLDFTKDDLDNAIILNW